MKKLFFVLASLLFAAGLLLGVSKALADSPDKSGNISATYNTTTGELDTSGSYSWNGCTGNNSDKYVGYALFVNGGTPKTNNSSALDGSSMHIANSGNPCTTTPGSWSDSHTLATAPTNVCVVFYDVRKQGSSFVSSGNHSNIGAGTGYNTDNSWDSAPGPSGSYTSGFCTEPTTVTTGTLTICHATSSNTNPYNQESPNIKNDGSLDGGHLNHTGPVWFSGITVSWGDIIPPYVSGNFNYPGLNWTTDGQAFYNNSCNIPTVTVTVTPSVTPTPTNTPSNGGGSAAGDGRSDGRSDGLSSCPSCTQAPQGNVQAVLGASTMAGTGTFENTVMNLMLVAGMIVLSLGGLSYAKEKK